MFSWDKTGDRVAIVQMNAELRHAQLELLSAQCATDRLRLRFSAEDIARHAQRDVLRRALSSANALRDYYSYIAQQVSDPELLIGNGSRVVGESQLQSDIEQLVRYLEEQRELFYPESQPLADDHRKPMAPFFSAQLLDKVRVTLLEGRRISTPSFFAEIRARGFANLPDLTHMRSATFDDVVVFQEPISPRHLFHALVHAAQYEVLGVRRYAELFVRAFLRTHSHVTVPLEAHAFALEVKFAGDPSQAFSVEEKVQLWANQRRYEY